MIGKIARLAGLYVSFGIAVAGLIGTSTYAKEMGSASPRSTPTCVKVEASFPRQVTMNVGEVTVPIQLTIRNNCAENVTLDEPNECSTHTYLVADLEGQVVESHTICPAIWTPVHTTIPAGRSLSMTNPVALDSKLYKNDDYYYVVYRSWGLSAPLQKFQAKIVK
jgi:hypothetical protein